MLDILLVILSTLLLPMVTNMYWHLTMIITVLCTMKIMLMMNTFSLVNISPMLMMDQMSSTLIMLSLWITALMLLASYKILHTNNMPKTFTSVCIMLLMTLIISFSSSSMAMFYIAFEASLIPTMMLIMMWGYQPERLQASMYLMVYTITASLPLLMMILKIYHNCKHLNMTMPEQMSNAINTTSMFWLMMITAFLVKLPLFSVHLWLPKAHVEAPVAGSMILAAILLKLGGYGLARMIMIFSHMNKTLMNPIMSVAMIGGVITSMICLRQSDMKSMIAYSSVGHMGLMVAGMLTNSKMGMVAGLSMMIAHGLSSSALFCMANINYGMTSTRSIMLTKGMLTIMPTMSFWWFMFCCANMAAPPSINLMSEIFLITAIMSQSIYIIIPLSMISFITVAYSLYLYSTTNHGPTMNMSSPMPYVTLSDMSLMTLHLVPILMLMLKPEMIISWC